MISYPLERGGSTCSDPGNGSNSNSSTKKSEALVTSLTELEIYYHSNLRLMGNGKGRRKLSKRHKQEFDETRNRIIAGDSDSGTPPLLPSPFREFAHAVCDAGCIPRKELFEAWAMACYVHHHFSTATRFADLASGHGLLGWALLVLNLTKNQEQNVPQNKNGICANNLLRVEDRSVVCIDIKMPSSVEKVSEAMLARWPHFVDKFDYVEGRLEGIVPHPSTVLVGVHCCHVLSDHVIQHAIHGASPLALVPCCHAKKCLTTAQRKSFQMIEQQQQGHKEQLPQQTTTGSLDNDFANMSIRTNLTDFLDNIRIRRLQSAGFNVREERIAKQYTPKNRLIIATPPSRSGDSVPGQDGAKISYCKPITTTNPNSATDTIPLISTDLPLLKAATPIRLWIPVADTPTSRATLHNMAGRAAAQERQRELEMEEAPTFMLSIIHPPGSVLVMEQIQPLLPSRAFMELCTYHNEGRPILLDPTREEVLATVAILPADDCKEASQQYAQSFRIRYPGESKHQAKALHRTLAERLPVHFPGTALRYALR